MKLFHCLLFFCSVQLQAQSYRGLAVLDDNSAWVSGSKGFVLRTTNGARSWDTLNPKGYEHKDFRDIHAWDKNTAIIMSSGDSAVVLKTIDGGKNWRKVYEDNSPGVFLDAMDFNGLRGAVIGDPRLHLATLQNDSVWTYDLLTTVDGGNSWSKNMSQLGLKIGGGEPTLYTSPGEALFAGSGSNIQLRKDLKKNHVLYFVTGGTQSRLWFCDINSYQETLPLKTGDGCGAFSVYIYNKNWAIVGGCWQKPNGRDSIACYYDNKEKKWKLAETAPGGYRSCVTASWNGKFLYCTGPNGTDISLDHGKTWGMLGIKGGDGKGYNVCACSKNYLWLAGDRGRIMRSDRRYTGKAE